MATVKKINSHQALITVNGMTRLVDVSDPEANEGEVELDEKLKDKFDHSIGRQEEVVGSARAASAVDARRQKMITIGEQSVASRNRVFPNFPHVQARRKNQAYDGLLALLMRGRIKQDDKILVRHLKTGEYDEMTVGQLLDEVGDMYLLQLELRKHDQAFRDKVNQIFKDPSKSDQDKAEAIEQLEVPEFLDVDEQSKEQVVRRSQNDRS